MLQAWFQKFSESCISTSKHTSDKSGLEYVLLEKRVTKIYSKRKFFFAIIVYSLDTRMPSVNSEEKLLKLTGKNPRESGQQKKLLFLL